ncbi:MAG: hypothetical protein LBO00_00680 [Zoogloeaceae bacterium]|jgi:methylase of polypeptide subunit release factors|nr:hypothetical protein [Zoogloeaceae bacterium]
MHIDAARYLGLVRAPERLKPTLAIHVAEHAFLPSVDEILGDWVATIAVPAFKLIREREGEQQAFCSIGAGVGLDVLAAIETLAASEIGLTDVHVDVVEAARQNVRDNLLEPGRIRLRAGCGDLLEPLAPTDGTPPPQYDLIYENLPNVPVDNAETIAIARASSGHLPPRKEEIPALMRRNLLALHYVALCKAKDFLKPGGSVLSLIGGRIPLAVFQEMGRLAGYRSEILTYGWKIQTDPEEMIGGHARQEAAGFGPYHFYRAEPLSTIFSSLDPAKSGAAALAIEQQLQPHAISPAEALQRWRTGEIIGHTVVALRSWRTGD